MARAKKPTPSGYVIQGSGGAIFMMDTLSDSILKRLEAGTCEVLDAPLDED